MTATSPMMRAFERLRKASLAALLLAAPLSGQTPTPLAPGPATTNKTDSPALSSENTPFAIILRAPSLAAALADARAQGRTMSDEEQRAYVATLRAAQDQVVARLESAGALEISRVGKALNAIFVVANSASTTRIAAFPEVRSVQSVTDMQIHAYPETNYKEVIAAIGAESLQTRGVDGTGVRVAVLDSGIDYTHAAFGGSGTETAYRAAYGRSPLSLENKQPVSWPQGRVIGGYDFVGELWPNSALQPDPNPIAAPPPDNYLGIVGTNGSHGTSVADILAGGPFPERPNNHGVAPGASLYAVKVCSAVSSSCSGIAMVQGIEWALDPDGDDSLSDAVDVINMSLGGDFGQKENPAAEAAANAARVGVVVCCAAGNGGDNPYIVSSPASTPEVISVAQTTMPSARLYPVSLTSSVASPNSIASTNTVPWAPVAGKVSGMLALPPSTLACEALPANSLTGRVAVIDRGDCAISYKVAYAQAAGAVGVILVNNEPGEPPTFSYTGIPLDLPSSFVISIPVLVVSQSDGNLLKARVLGGGETVTASFSDSAYINISSSIASTSSRGPSLTYNAMKPEISAPGASLAAVAGSGTQFAVFGGTSGSTPVVAGAAALVRQKFPGLPPLEVKARLMNHADSNIFQNPLSSPGEYAPLSRAGAGEVRAQAAVDARASAWVAGANGAPSLPALSFGYWRLSGPQSFTQTVRVKNDSPVNRTFSITSETRFSPGQPGAVTLAFPGSISVPASSAANFDVTVSVDPSKLPAWNTNSGQFASDGPRLAAQEFGGFVTIKDAADTLRLPWHILPHRAHRALVSTSSYKLGAPAPTLSNSPSSTPATASLFALTGVSPRLAAGSYPAPGDNFAVTDLQYVGVRLVDYGPTYGLGLEFAITTWDRRTHANYPALFQVAIDVNNDGIPDWYLFNQRVSLTGPDWRNATYLRGADWSTSFGTFYTNTDFNSANIILQVPLNRLGLTVPSVPSQYPVANPLPATQPITFTVQVFDDYFTGQLDDEVGPMVYTPAAPKYVVNGTLGTIDLPANSTTPIPISSTGLTGSPAQTGVLFMFNNGRTRYESQAVKVQ